MANLRSEPTPHFMLLCIHTLLKGDYELYSMCDLKVSDAHVGSTRGPKGLSCSTHKSTVIDIAVIVSSLSQSPSFFNDDKLHHCYLKYNTCLLSILDHF